MNKVLTKTVWLLGLVSLFTDMASEMLYPIMPFYLKSIGFSVVGIGLLEGVAQATAGLSKGYFGKWSDNNSRRLPFVQIGYFLSAISKPLMAVSTSTWWIFTARTTDRFGKGIRSGARDALLSAEANQNTKGQIFGFHRSMDTLGAAIGPLLALIFLWYKPGAYQLLFFLATIPGILAITATLLIKEKVQENITQKGKPGILEFLKYIPDSSSAYRKLLFGLLFFAILNSSDLFLLMVLKEKGFSDTTVIGFYIFYNLIYALAAYPIGILSDKKGKKPIFIIGLLLFSLVYGGMALRTDWWFIGFLFFGYGLYAACTEGIAKAWISNICHPKDTATAIGTYDGLSSIAALISSSIAGLVWYYFGAMALFIGTAIFVFILVFYFLWLETL